MKKTILLLAILFLTAGCSYQIRNYSIEKANTICKEHKGIFHIYRSPLEYAVRCNDGFVTDLPE